MKIGRDQIEIATSKIQHYLLNTDHPDGSSKASFFRTQGFNIKNKEVFRESLKLHLLNNPVVSRKKTIFGINYVVDGNLETPSIRNVYIRSIWFQEKESKIFK